MTEATVHHVRTTLISERLSACGLFRLPMDGCSGPVVMTWLRLPSAGVSVLVKVTPLRPEVA